MWAVVQKAQAEAPRTVLLLHAFPLSARMWDAQKAALEERGLRALAPNLPGFGGAAGAMTAHACGPR